jgi:hypothetical protein
MRSVHSGVVEDWADIGLATPPPASKVGFDVTNLGQFNGAYAHYCLGRLQPRGTGLDSDAPEGDSIKKVKFYVSKPIFRCPLSAVGARPRSRQIRDGKNLLTRVVLIQRAGLGRDRRGSQGHAK